jgi:hypothetical protein
LLWLKNKAGLGADSKDAREPSSQRSISFKDDPAQSRSSERHCAKISGGQLWTTPIKAMARRAEKSGNLRNPHGEKMLQPGSQTDS